MSKAQPKDLRMSERSDRSRGAACSTSPPMCRATTGARAAKVFKLSSNETPLGPSPLAIEAYRANADRLHVYPEGSARMLREAIAAAYGLNPERIVCGNGSDELLTLLAQTYLSPGDEAIFTAARIPRLPDRHPRLRRHAGRRAGDGGDGERRRDPRARHAEDAARLSRQPEQPDRHLSAPTTR